MAVPPKLSETIMSLAARTCTDAIDATRRIARIDAVETGVDGGDEVADEDEDMEDEVEDEVEEQASSEGARGAAGRNCFLRIAMSGSASRRSSASVMPRS